MENIYDSFINAERIVYILASRTERELRSSGPYSNSPTRPRPNSSFN